MTLTIKIDESKKQKLDRFLAKLLLHSGKKVTIQEAVGAMIDHALEDEEQFMTHFQELPPLEEDPAWQLLEKPKNWGVKDASQKIDETLYG
ncbi:MAG: hypothetical protein NWE93_13195 [Candidatus Bathyarchaeota archaeon]|nr:hypothetical protein [Candidatus Bathyarchaeota archaeon]